MKVQLKNLSNFLTFLFRKFEEIYPPEVAEFVYITDDTYSAKQVCFFTVQAFSP